MVIATLDERIRQLHAAGLDDPTIGRIVRISTQAVWRARTRLGLEVPKEPTAERVRELHAEGLDDAKIGRVLGCCTTTARYHRIALGLPVVSAVRAERYDEQIRELYEDGLSDPQIGGIMSVHRETVRARRVAMGLQSRYCTSGGTRTTTDPTDYAEIDRTALAWSMFRVGRSVEDVAAAVGVSPDAARDYRETMPPNWGPKFCGKATKSVKVYAGSRRGGGQKVGAA